MKLSELIKQLTITPLAMSFSPTDPDLNGVAALDQARPGMLSFVEGLRWADQEQQLRPVP